MSIKLGPGAASAGAETDPVAGPALTTHAALTTSAHGGIAPSASPTFTGTPAAPTASQGTNTTQVATTAYVQTEVGLLVPKSLVDAKGDLLVGSADNTVVRKAVGADGTALVADAASAGGVKWALGLPVGVVLGSDVSNSTTSYADVTGMGVAVLSGATYSFLALLIWQSAQATTGAGFSVSGPASPTLFANHAMWTGATGTTLSYAFARTYDAIAASTGVATPNATYFAEVKGIITPSADGTLIPRFVSEVGASAITVKAGSILQVWRMG